MNWNNGSSIESVAVNKYISNLSSQTGSKGEKRVRNIISKYFQYDVWLEQFIIPHTRLRVDFMCPSIKLVIEFDGDAHYKFNEFFHNNRLNFLASIKRDAKKEELLEKNGYRIVRLVESDLKLSDEELYNKILNDSSDKISNLIR